MLTNKVGWLARDEFGFEDGGHGLLAVADIEPEVVLVV